MSAPGKLVRRSPADHRDRLHDWLLRIEWREFAEVGDLTSYGTTPDRDALLVGRQRFRPVALNKPHVAARRRSAVSGGTLSG